MQIINLFDWLVRTPAVDFSRYIVQIAKRSRIASSILMSVPLFGVGIIITYELESIQVIMTQVLKYRLFYGLPRIIFIAMFIYLCWCLFSFYQDFLWKIMSVMPVILFVVLYASHLSIGTCLLYSVRIYGYLIVFRFARIISGLWIQTLVIFIRQAKMNKNTKNAIISSVIYTCRLVTCYLFCGTIFFKAFTKYRFNIDGSFSFINVSPLGFILIISILRICTIRYLKLHTHVFIKESGAIEIIKESLFDEDVVHLIQLKIVN
jgi:hypothetical protein